jgi:hypothetical protein
VAQGFPLFEAVCIVYCLRLWQVNYYLGWRITLTLNTLALWIH